eukprot:7587141-Prorocentrum_lima.AAC.1
MPYQYLMAFNGLKSKSLGLTPKAATPVSNKVTRNMLPPMNPGSLDSFYTSFCPSFPALEGLQTE